jgi:DNA-binding response OmpR family regulator
MRIVVASGNIFRREFSSYILAEAGYEINEARTAEELMGALRGDSPAALVIDHPLTGGEPAATIRAIRALSEAPIIWIGDPHRMRPLLMIDQRPAQAIQWPFRGEELIAAVVTLSARHAADLAALAHPERFAGSTE